MIASAFRLIQLRRGSQPPPSINASAALAPLPTEQVATSDKSTVCKRDPAVTGAKKLARRDTRVFATTDEVSSWAKGATVRAISKPDRRPVRGPVSVELMRAGTAKNLNRVHGLALYNWLVVHEAGAVLTADDIGEHYRRMLRAFEVSMERPLNMILGELRQLIGPQNKRDVRVIDEMSGPARARVYAIPKKKVPSRFRQHDG